MASYKVPQDVEADDKLIGPFSFRQFIYLIIVAIAGFLAYVLAQVFIGLIIIPLPVIVFFGALALPLRKDQPMETYLAAVVRFFLKPKKRMWDPEGTVNLVQIIAPRVVERRLSKDISQDDAQSRLNYLANLMDTRGWSTRGVTSPNDAVVDTVAAEAASTNDIMDDNAAIAQSFNNRLVQQQARQRQDAMLRMQEAAQHADATAQTTIPQSTTAPATVQPSPPVAFNPYPTMHQHVLSPAGQAGAPPPAQPATLVSPQPSPQPQTSMTPEVSPDILQLANNNDLSISAIAREAHRRENRDDENEVVISLR